ncbi:glycoside hydrolase family protein [Aeoliella mucimassa]|uniref:Glycosyl hydrolase family 32 N-terminal domain-containing protein n=1 Tax=Aeoliella mucimassa TaxID=2527972 RepID=A0A518AQ89_9BACT|nr:hypothetical protein [Aeoliella mucimassa]QDU56885.1 hypothetical protein Pan181_30970 [Aeoliella mucimassa]
MTRFCDTAARVAYVALALAVIPFSAQADTPTDLTSKRELFVDSQMIDTMDGVKLELQKPNEEEVVIVHDEPWEGNTSCYHTVFFDDGKYRMYYRGAHFDESTGKSPHAEVFCYAESTDGIHWVKPNLGLHEFNGSKDNNIVIATPTHAHCFAPFRDANPAATADAKYKALTRSRGGLVAYESPDAIHWTLVSSKPVITDGAFDSLNIAYWDSYRQHYVDFHRDFREGVRDIKTCTSDDFTNWTVAEWLSYEGAPTQHLYTNGIVSYHRAPQLFVGLPKRFNPSRNPSNHSQGGVSDCVFMSSRDGETFHRWNEAFVRPGQQANRWVNRNNLPAWGIVETEADTDDAPNQLSLYMTEGYYRGPGTRLRRYTLRLDGFVSIDASAEGGEFTTKPVILSKAGTPTELRINFATSAIGNVRCEILDDAGKVLPGFSLEECDELMGDKVDAVVTWKGKSSLLELSDKPVTLRFVMKDADLYAIHLPEVDATINESQASK